MRRAVSSLRPQNKKQDHYSLPFLLVGVERALALFRWTSMNVEIREDESPFSKTPRLEARGVD
jgi:hypothetical protein